VHDRHPLILDRDAELAAMTAGMTAAAGGHGTLILLRGPLGIGRTTMLGAACAAAAAHGLRALTARGLALERGFSYGIVRQLLEPARAAAGPDEWDALLAGGARPARRVFDGAEPTAAEAGAVEGEAPHATVHGLYWLTANQAARGPLLLAVDDAHWADAPSLRWLSHLAARIDNLPILLLLTARSGPDEPDVISELGDYPACVRLEPRPLDSAASAAVVREGLGDRASPELGRAAHASTGGNPFLLDALVKALLALDTEPDEATAASLGPRPVADAVTRRIGPCGPGAAALVRALAVLGGPAPLRSVAALADMELPLAALLTDRLRAASVLAAGALLEFEHPIAATAVYDSVPPGERALAHARAAVLLEADGAGPELIGWHLLRSEPDANARAVTVLRAAAAAASGRGAQDVAAGYLRRALAEPPPAQARPALLLDLGLALASDRDEGAVVMLRDAVAQAGDAGQPGDTGAPGDSGQPGEPGSPSRAAAALLAAGVLGVWGHHDSATDVARAGLSAPGGDPCTADRLEAELFANAWVNAATARSAWDRIRPRLDSTAGDPPAGPGLVDWHVYEALSATAAARPGSAVMARFAPVLAEGTALLQRDSLCVVAALLVLIWNDELERALAVSDAVLADAGTRGSLNMVASVRCLRSMILRRLGRLQEAADDGRAGLDFKLKTAPPLAVAWAAAFLVEALTKIGKYAEAEEVVAVAEERRPPDGWIHTIMFAQARGALRVSEQRPAEGLADLRTAAEGWRALGVSSPAGATWRVPAVAACTALGRHEEAARLAAEQLELARAAGTPAALGVSLRIAAPFTPDPERTLAEAISLLEAVDGRYEQGLALAELGTHRRRAGRRGDAREPLRRALDYAERTGAERLRGYARAELLAVGARPRRAALTGPDALTSAERQVSALAAEGRSNRQIAQHLFIAQATVETHLRHAFHKLGITSRADLPARLARGHEGD
jgi:DNA-binding CsgD family transcriptional regulator